MSKAGKIGRTIRKIWIWKSSLINAGLWPAVEKEAVPIIVRFGSYVPSQTMRPLDQLRKRINEVIIDNPDSNVLNLEQLQGLIHYGD
ncbi:MAG: hypothetical protein IPO07_15900 [Haliscomenobacter sp.]|nr:hypothetical protein [Haliscomenobacter sp.]MBK9490084.1 hypothetical protein [Haliscomenobacter sp.]